MTTTTTTTTTSALARLNPRVKKKPWQILKGGRLTNHDQAHTPLARNQMGERLFQGDFAVTF